MNASYRVVSEIYMERGRQMVFENRTPSKEDKHKNGEMANEAACYCLGKKLRFWPWDTKWWKPKDRRKDLIRAAALIVAEIERIDRSNASDNT